MRKVFYNETSLRIISVLIAVILWMYVVGIRNPQVEINYRAIPITIANTSSMDKNGLKIVSMTAKTADVKVMGRRTDVTNIEAANISVKIDASTVSGPNKYVLPTETSIVGNGVTVSDVSVKNVEVLVDYMVTKEKNVKVNVSGTAKDGFVAGEPVLSIKSVFVQGPQQFVDRVAYAKINVDIDNIDKNTVQTGTVILVDINGNEMELSYLSLNYREISVEIPVYKTKQVQIIPKYSEPFDPAVTNSTVTVTPNIVTIYGEKDVVDSITNLETAVIDVSKFNNLEEHNIRVDVIVPEKVNIIEDVKEVDVKIAKNVGAL